jgi:hypothetical protein
VRKQEERIYARYTQDIEHPTTKMPLFRRKKASSDPADEVEGEIREKKKWLHRPASRLDVAGVRSLWFTF